MNNQEVGAKAQNEVLTVDLTNSLRNNLSEQSEAIASLKIRIGRIHQFIENKISSEDLKSEPVTHVEKLRDINSVLHQNNAELYRILEHLSTII